MKYSIVGLKLPFLMILTACSAQSTNKNADVEIIYLLENSKAIDVFNVERNWISHEGIEYLDRRNQEYGEFGGTISVCSTERFHCLRGGISVVIPKGPFDSNEWRLDEIECKTESTSGKEEKTITCKRRNNLVTFVYSSRYGIISYVRSSQPGWVYKLMGNKGLFSQL
jgi:hypothetical protein